MPAMKMRTGGLVAAMLMATFSMVRAEEPAGLRFEIIPTAFIAGTDGSITVKGTKVEFDKTAGDLFKYVEFSGGVAGLVQYNRWVFRAQFDFFRMSTDALKLEDQPTGGKLDTDLYITTAAAGYQFHGWKEGQTYDVLIGLRALRADNTLEVYGVGSRSADRDLFDPALILRGNLPLFTGKITGLSLAATAAVGGGGDSQLIYDLQPALHYLVSENVGVRLGYRRLGWRVEGDENDGELKFALSGLFGGMSVTF